MHTWSFLIFFIFYLENNMDTIRSILDTIKKVKKSDKNWAGRTFSTDTSLQRVYTYTTATLQEARTYFSCICPLA